MRMCRLEEVVGRNGACPEAQCPFWEPGGTALGGRCGVEAVAALQDPQVAEWLLQLRQRLEAAKTEAGSDDAWRQFAHALNKGESD